MKNYTFNGTHLFIAIVIFQFFLLLVPLVQSNPIPVWPDPQPDYTPPTEMASSGFSIAFWILFIFLLDFGLDIIITYSGLYIIDLKIRPNHIQYFEDFSRTSFIGAVLLISLIGIVAELILGMWIVGMLFVLFIVFLSFYLVSFFLFKLSKDNCLFMGFFAVMINSVAWAIIFSLWR